MAVARVIIRNADGQQTTLEVECDQMFEGALGEAVDQVLRLYRDALAE